MMQVKITKIENNKANVALPDGQTFNIPLSLIKGEPQTDSIAYLMIATPGAEGEAGADMARNLLNELIGKDE